MVTMSIPSGKQYDRMIYDIMMLKSKQYLSLNCFVSAMTITWLCGDLSFRRGSCEGICEVFCAFMFWCLVLVWFFLVLLVCLFLFFCWFGFLLLFCLVGFCYF